MRFSKRLKLRIGIIAGIAIIVISVSITLPFVDSDYEHNLQFTISDAIQIMVVASAILLPLITPHWNKQEFGPKVKIKFKKSTPYERVIYNTPDFEELWLFLGIQNTGKTILNSCEVVIQKVERKVENSSRWETCNDFIPSNLYWHFSDPEIEQHIHWFANINPSRELFVCFGFYSEQNPFVEPVPKESIIINMSEPSKIQKTLWPTYLHRGVPFSFSFAEYLQQRPNTVQRGLFRITIVIYGENIDPITQKFLFDWSGEPKLPGESTNRIPPYSITLLK
ncbi:hypothetical protein KQH56_01585 [bacterium]|nr:hypothetical protein [bacterium]